MQSSSTDSITQTNSLGLAHIQRGQLNEAFSRFQEVLVHSKQALKLEQQHQEEQNLQCQRLPANPLMVDCDENDQDLMKLRSIKSIDNNEDDFSFDHLDLGEYDEDFEHLFDDDYNDDGIDQECVEHDIVMDNGQDHQNHHHYRSSRAASDRKVFSFLEVMEDEILLFQQEGHIFLFFEIFDEDSVQECALRAVFNLATCHYWKGMCEGQHSGHLLTAVRLYELGYEMSTASTDDINNNHNKPTQQEMNPLILLACANNLGKLHEVLALSSVSATSSMTRSIQCFEKLLQGLIFFSNEDVECQILSSLKDHFWSNTTHLVLQERGFAPAA